MADLEACTVDSGRPNGGAASPVTNQNGFRSTVIVSEGDQTPAQNQQLSTCSGSLNFSDVTPEPFDGDRLQFRSFLAQFRNWIDRRKGLTPLDKQVVLRKHLRGEAKGLVDSLEISDYNYQVALDLLQQAFGRVDIERQQIMATLFNLTRVTI